MSIENIVPQWAETDQNDLTETGMYGQKVTNLNKFVLSLLCIYTLIVTGV